MHKKKIAIIGATGFTGSELIRILVGHPDVEIKLLTSESKSGQAISTIHPFLQGINDQVLVSADLVDETDELDLIFLALPHGVSMDFVQRFEKKSFRIIDLSGDFRLSSPEIYEQWYKMPHRYHHGFSKAAYGIPELFSDEIKQASLVANPGCFPTGALLCIAPLVKAGIVKKQTIIIDSKTGVTGAGVQSKPVNHFSNVNDNFRAYGLKNHRHTIEIEEVANKIGAGELQIQFTPHLLPVDRGILTTVYAKPSGQTNEVVLQALYKAFYAQSPFVRLRGQQPAIKEVRGTNYCDINISHDDRTNTIIVTGVIDNLVRGAAGQAVQNMNLMFGWEEMAGLRQVPMVP